MDILFHYYMTSLRVNPYNSRGQLVGDEDSDEDGDEDREENDDDKNLVYVHCPLEDITLYNTTANFDLEQPVRQALKVDQEKSVNGWSTRYDYDLGCFVICQGGTCKPLITNAKLKEMGNASKRAYDADTTDPTPTLPLPAGLPAGYFKVMYLRMVGACDKPKVIVAKGDSLKEVPEPMVPEISLLILLR